MDRKDRETNESTTTKPMLHILQMIISLPTSNGKRYSIILLLIKWQLLNFCQPQVFRVFKS